MFLRLPFNGQVFKTIIVKPESKSPNPVPRFLSAFLPEFPSVIENADLVHLGVRVLLRQEDDSGHVMII